MFSVNFKFLFRLFLKIFNFFFLILIFYLFNSIFFFFYNIWKFRSYFLLFFILFIFYLLNISIFYLLFLYLFWNLFFNKINLVSVFYPVFFISSRQIINKEIYFFNILFKLKNILKKKNIIPKFY